MVPSPYAEAVLDLVARIPAARVMTYGDIADVLGRGGARSVGTVLARYGAGVPWHRVVRADGRPAAGHETRALNLLSREGISVANGRIEGIHALRWSPSDPVGTGTVRPPC